MNILVVEDNDTKASEIVSVVSKYATAPVFHTKSLRATYPALKRGGWNLVILDMTLHAAEGPYSSSSKESLAGLEVLQAIATQGSNCKVIVATQHDNFKAENILFSSIAELDGALSKVFGRNYHGAVRVTLGRDEWKDQLRSLVEKLE